MPDHSAASGLNFSVKVSNKVVILQVLNYKFLKMVSTIPERHPDVHSFCVFAQSLPWTVNFNKHDITVCNSWLQKEVTNKHILIIQTHMAFMFLKAFFRGKFCSPA